MTGPEHYAEAERLLTLADRHTRGVTYAQEWTLSLTAAQVHATAVGMTGPDRHAWADAAATRPSASNPDAPEREPAGVRPLDRGPSSPVPAGG